MPRWSLSPATGDTVQALKDSLNQRLVDLDLILSELEQVEQQVKGQGGYTAQMSGPLDMRGFRLMGLPDRPRDRSDACSWRFHQSGDFMYSESDTFRTDKRVEHQPATTGSGSVTLDQLMTILANQFARQVPTGVILLWSGAVAAIPSGWALCDGTLGTPDLRDRFLVGAGGAYAVGATGGASVHTHIAHPLLVHTGTAVVDHAAFTHTSGGAHAHDAHTTATDTAIAGAATRLTGPGTHTSDGGHTHDAHPALVHAVTQPADHASQAHDSPDHRPLYYSLAYIMKL